jgi:basic membrane protein A and related proteins
MKKYVIVVGLALLAVTSAQQNFNVGIVFSDSVKNDRSFNQRTAEGVQRASKSFGNGIKEFVPGDPTEIETGIRKMAKDGVQLIVGVGFTSESAVTTVAKEMPETKFAVIDAVPQGGNTTGLVFREQEGSFLVGYVAGTSSSTGVVGFVGGMDIPLIHKFEAGFKAGVLRACPSCKVVAGYVGTTPSAWTNPAKAKEIAASQVAQGADIIYAAAGASGNGALDYVKNTLCMSQSALPRGMRFKTTNIAKSVAKPAGYAGRCDANSRPLFFIGVDSNQNYLGDTDNNPKTLNVVLTSMEKRVDNAIYAIIHDYSKGMAWRSGAREFGLKDFGIGYAVDEYNSNLIPKTLIDKIAQIKQMIITGKIVVPSTR